MLSGEPIKTEDFSSTDTNQPSIKEMKESNKPIKKHDEQQYLEMIRHIIDNGVTKSDRTGKATVLGSLSFSLVPVPLPHIKHHYHIYLNRPF